MFLTIFDLVLILIIFCFVAFGFAMGLVQSLGALIGIVLGAFLAGKFYLPVADWLTPIFLGNVNTAKIVAFVIVFTIINRSLGLIFYIINKVFNLISIVPFLKSFNRLLGALFGLVEGVFFLGIILHFVTRLTIAVWFNEIIASSQVAYFLIFIAKILTPLLPDVIKQIQEVK